MMGRNLFRKTTSEITHFLYENQRIYTTTLKDFLNCSYRHASRISLAIRGKYNIKTKWIPSEIVWLYISEVDMS